MFMKSSDSQKILCLILLVEVLKKGGKNDSKKL